ncbi:MAG: radical SAM protein [Treponema sp.]|nr:radical SAM protein [Treponema sp.]
MKVSFYTLGCKLNQNETEALSDAFVKEGFTVLPWGFPENDPLPLLCIINTCTVTSKAEQKARRIIRYCLHYGCTVLVTGCYAQLEQKAIEILGEEKNSAGELFIFPGQGKEKLLDLPRYLVDTLNGFDKNSLNINSQFSTAISNFISQSSEDRKVRKEGSKITEMHTNLCDLVSLREEKREIISRNPFSFNPRHFSFHSRSFLKIQDGCDYSCAYCRVPLARGKSISLESKEVLARLKALEDFGMAEAVLTGVNICQYTDPENSSRRLPELLRFLLDNTRSIAIRLSSIEPDTHSITNCNTENSGVFFKALSHPRIRNHFHLSVQSGSDSVLAVMGRNYKAQDIIWMVKKLREIRDDPFIACDIITGFPGETEDDFEKTAGLCRIADFAWIHVFPYSKRPGTTAASIKKGIVSERVAGKRLNLLMDYAKSGKNEYIRRWQGKIVDAVAINSAGQMPIGKDSPSESPGEPVQTGITNDFFPFFPALTDNYIKIRCNSRERIALDGSYRRIAPGNACRCRIVRAASPAESGFDAWAELIE